MSNIITEEWRYIPGYEGRYQASNLGKVRSVDRCIVTGAVPLAKIKGKTLKPAASSTGYLNVVLNRKTQKVHRLVALTWIANPENKPQVNHKDANKANNQVDNLEWVTAKENKYHAVKLKIHSFGETRPGAKLSKETVNQILTLHQSGPINQSELARKYGVHPSVVCRIVNRQKWKIVG